MRRYYAILITLPLVFDPGAVVQRPVLPVAKTGELVVLTRNSGTTRYIDSQGRYAGLEYDLVELFARELGVRVRYLDRQPFYQVLPALEENHAHLAAAGVAITSDRLNQFLFGPAYQLVQPTLAYNTGIRGGALGRGAAISLFLFPLLLPAIILLLRTLRRRQY